jgi:CDP-ribitol ribitolphosphotransferase
MRIELANPRHWLLLGQQYIYTLLAAVGRRISPRPRKPLVILHGHQLSGNLKALYDQWRQVHTGDFDCYYLSLDPENSATLRRQGVRVLQCNRLRDMLQVGRCDAIITDHGLHLMSPLLRLTDIKFIDVWHGIPFKGFVPEDFQLQQRYHEVWVSSPLLKSIYEQQFKFAPEKVIDMGYARADKLFRGELPANSYRRQAAMFETHKLVLYAPTWQQDHQGHESFPFGESQESFIEALSQVCSRHSATLVIRSHLNARISEKAFDNVLYCPMKTFPDTEGLLQETDVLICDWSSIAFDYLALNRPAIFVDVKSPYLNGFSLGPEYRYGEVVGDMRGLTQQLAALLRDPGDYASRRGTTLADITAQVYGEHTDGLASRRQLERLAKMIARNTQ